VLPEQVFWVTLVSLKVLAHRGTDVTLAGFKKWLTGCPQLAQMGVATWPRQRAPAIKVHVLVS
jgi:hypothetical protein